MGLVRRDSRAANTYRLRDFGLSGGETAERGGIATGRPDLTATVEVEKPREHVEIMLFCEEEV
jgi:hypothetical protein